MPDTYFGEQRHSPFKISIRTQASQRGTKVAWMYVHGGEEGCVSAWRLDTGPGGGEKGGLGNSISNPLSSEWRARILPRRVRSGDEEVDDHPVTHVETVLHRPTGQKTRLGGIYGKPDGKYGPTTLQFAFPLSVPVVRVPGPLKPPAAFNTMKPKVRALHYC